LQKQRLPGTGEKPLDRWLRELMPGRSWNDVRRLARTGKIFIDGLPLLDPTRLVPAGAELEFRQNAPRATRAPALARHGILFVDAHVVVVDKPAGISTVPYDENETGTLDALVMETLSERGRRAPLGIVHRVDKETSGVVIFARSVAAKHHLKNQFRFHTVGRRYVAVAHGSVRAGTITSRLVQDRGDGRRGSTDNPELGREATTHVAVLKKLQGASLLECRLETGRTHQIRIHLAEQGHPLVGEKVYSKGYRGVLITAPRLMLHARELSFEHPHTGQRLSFEQPVPKDMQNVIEGLERQP
jgi:23S rRNA pseudouridine1911/1915/1917 synthase